MLDDVVTVRHRRGEVEILLNEKDGKALRFEPRDGASDLLNDDWSEPLGRLVEHQKSSAGAQDSCDRQHLLLPARQFCTLAVEPFLKIGKQVEDLIQRQPAAAHDRRQQKIFADVEARENPTLFRTDGESHPRNLV